MCGIAGLISPNPEERIAPMLKAIEHRGRDDQGVYVSAPFGDGLKACLGHRRLSIIDTSSAGHQPFLSDDKRFALTYNGEIYNYKEVRAELESAGESFRTESDTEVLLKAFQVWGAACLEKLNGMFAFAIWDDREKTLFAARDRVGLKPFHYSEIDGNFIFASEIKAILASRLVEPRLDDRGFDQFLTFLWPVPPHTMFAGVSQLLPGHYLIWKDGDVSTHEYWDIDFSAEEKGGSEREWVDRVSETFDRVVRMEMISDVPLGAFLSGGVDSSSIVACMARGSAEQVTAYTTGISASDLEYDIIPDDVKWSRIVANTFDVDYHETLLSPQIEDLLPTLVRAQEAPIIDMAIPSYLISQQARERQKVMLSGMGGDEIFAGYPRHMAMKLASATDIIPPMIRRPLMSAADSLLYGGRRGRFTAPLRNAKKFARSAAMGFENRYLGFGTYFTEIAKKSLLAPETQARIGDMDPYEYHRQYFAKTENLSPLNRLLYVDFKTFMPALNLDTIDRTSMAVNLEVRAPFLNKDLVELSARIPSRLKLKGLTRKYILKKAAEKMLPREVVWRRKAGFGAPVRSWMRGALQRILDEFLSDSAVRERGLFRPEAIAKLRSENVSGREDNSLQLFQLLTLELWFREFID